MIQVGVAGAAGREFDDENIVRDSRGAFEVAQHLADDGVAFLFQNIQRESGVMRGERRAVVKPRLRSQKICVGELVGGNPHLAGDETIIGVALVEALVHQAVEDERHAGGASQALENQEEHDRRDQQAVPRTARHQFGIFREPDHHEDGAGTGDQGGGDVVPGHGPLSHAVSALIPLACRHMKEQQRHGQCEQARADLKGQRPCVLWFTGLSGAGKSTIANLVEKKLHAAGCHSYLLDGDNVRHGLNRDLGFTDQDRVENIRRVAEVAKLMTDAGLIVLTAFISPFRAERQMVRDLMAEGEFLEIFVDVPLEVAERREATGLYAKARRGEIKHFTGISSPYEDPASPDLRIDTSVEGLDEAVDRVRRRLEATLGQ